MSSAAPTAASAPDGQASIRRRRHAKPPVSRRAALQLLVGVLIVGAIPIVSTARILQANALRNERDHVDAALRGQLQTGLRELTRLGNDASRRAGDLARSPVVQHALLGGRRGELKQLAAARPGTAFYLRNERVAGAVSPAAIEQAVWLNLDGKRIGKVVASVPLNRQLARRLTLSAPRGPDDRLLLARQGRVLGSGQRLHTDGHTVRLAGVAYRALPGVVPDAARVRLLALRPESAIKASVAPYRARIQYAAMGSFALLVLVAFLCAGPILRVMGDFRRVASQATTDSLTGLANRRTLDEELALEWRRADRVGDSLAFVLLDLDDFKRINDSHGHQAGDAVLRAVGEILGSGVRQVDLAGRYGGEEFALILPETDLSGAQQLAERLRAALATAHIELPDGASLQTTGSFGVAVKGEFGAAEELVSAADEALYEAKRAGKNRVAPEPSPDPLEPGKPERRRPRKATPKTAPKAATKAAPKVAKKTSAAKKTANEPIPARKPRAKRTAEGKA